MIVGYLLLLIPLGIFWYYQIGLIRQTLIAIVRMTVQLLLVGLYLGWLIKEDNMIINILWIMLMLVVANYSIVSRGQLNWRAFFFPVFFAMLISITLVDAFFLKVAIRLDHVFEARFLVPISGMIMGNCLRSNIIALNTFYHDLHHERAKYRYFLACGGKRGEALFPFMQKALKSAFNPVIATMAVIGLVALPGTMTGQIISGSDPTTAIKYQILFMICVFVASISTVFLTILFANHFAFDKYDRFKEGIIKSN